MTTLNKVVYPTHVAIQGLDPAGIELRSYAIAPEHRVFFEENVLGAWVIFWGKVLKVVADASDSDRQTRTLRCEELADLGPTSPDLQPCEFGQKTFPVALFARLQKPATIGNLEALFRLIRAARVPELQEEIRSTLVDIRGGLRSDHIRTLCDQALVSLNAEKGEQFPVVVISEIGMTYSKDGLSVLCELISAVKIPVLRHVIRTYLHARVGELGFSLQLARNALCSLTLQEDHPDHP